MFHTISSTFQEIKTRSVALVVKLVDHFKKGVEPVLFHLLPHYFISQHIKDFKTKII